LIQEEFPKGVLEKEFSTSIPPEIRREAQKILIFLEDWAGNKANYTISLTGTQNKTTQPATTQTPATITTRASSEWKAEEAPGRPASSPSHTLDTVKPRVLGVSTTR
jgi:hypothetical protein